MKPLNNMDKAKGQLLLKHPFFGSIIMNYPLTEANIPTFGITPRGRIYYNPKFADSLSVQQVVFALAHEAMHKVGRHARRRGGRDKRIWNMANDAWINDTLREAKVGEWIPGIVDMPGARNMTSEQIYDLMMKDPPPEQKGLGSGMGDDMLDEDGDELSEEEERVLDARAKLDIAKATALAKMAGKLPKSIEEWAYKTLEVKTPWFEILERYMTKMTQIEQTWSRPNRRFMSAGVYMPSYAKQPSMGPVGIVIDESGSISEHELSHFGAHANRILEDCHPEKIYVLHVSSVIHKVEEFTPEDLPITFKQAGSGGTDMRVGVEWLNENVPELEACVVLTDGYTPFPHNEVVPTFWAITTDVKAPAEAGTTLHIDVEKEK